MKTVKKVWKNKRKEITLILVNVMVLTLFFSGHSIAKGFHCIDIRVNANIAGPILIVEHTSTVEMDGKKETEYYNFKVKNYNEKGEITPIDLTYYIEILPQTEEAIFFKLYKNNQEIPLENNKTTNRELQKENKQEDEYQLEIIYDKTKNRSMSDYIVQEISIKVHAEQIKR